MKKLHYIIGIAGILGAALASQAANIASYDFNGADRTAQLQDKALSAEVDASVFSFGAGLKSTTPIVNTGPTTQSFVYDDVTGSAVAGPLSGDQYTLIGREDSFGFSDRSGGSTQATAITDNDYLQFSFTVEAGQTVDMGILSWQEFSRNPDRGASDWSIFVSYDDFANSSLMGTGATIGWTLNTTQYYEQSVDLSGEATLIAGETATIRLYMYGKTNGNNSNSEVGFDSFSFATAVPEPSSFALLGGLLALGHVMVRRRR